MHAEGAGEREREKVEWGRRNKESVRRIRTMKEMRAGLNNHSYCPFHAINFDIPFWKMLRLKGNSLAQ